MSLPSNHVLHNYDILNMLVYKTLWGKGKKGEEDGMNLKDNIGRNARPTRGSGMSPASHVLLVL